MWIISKKYGAFNTDSLSAILPPRPEYDGITVHGYDSVQRYNITEGGDSYQKILEAIANDDRIVEVS